MLSFKKFIVEMNVLEPHHDVIKQLLSNPNTSYKEISNHLLNKHNVDVTPEQIHDYASRKNISTPRRISMKLGLGDEHISKIKDMMDKGAHRSEISDYIQNATGKPVHPKTLEDTMRQISPRGHSGRVYKVRPGGSIAPWHKDYDIHQHNYDLNSSEGVSALRNKVGAPSDESIRNRAIKLGHRIKQTPEQMRINIPDEHLDAAHKFKNSGRILVRTGKSNRRIIPGAGSIAKHINDKFGTSYNPEILRNRMKEYTPKKQPVPKNPELVNDVLKTLNSINPNTGQKHTYGSTAKIHGITRGQVAGYYNRSKV